MECRPSNGRWVYNTLSALNYESKKDQLVHWDASSEGIKLITRGQSNDILCSVWFTTRCFRTYKCDGAHKFAVPINALLAGIQEQGSLSTIRIQYSVEKATLSVILAEEGMVHECTIRVEQSPPDIGESRKFQIAAAESCDTFTAPVRGGV
eukprot:GHVO01057828.1.p2 GENE.GHVO01057828.1~~GHVO01057828.1.p2  ORF type:complete len:151 (+),score=17.95 GHVO01057828.1:200-652(+)